MDAPPRRFGPARPLRHVHPRRGGLRWPRPDGSVGADREPVAIFSGEAVPAYLGHLPDAAIEAMLNELAAELGAALGQERLYVSFHGRAWILDSGAPDATA